MRHITCRNHDNGFMCNFSEDDFSPFILASVDGIYSVKNKVTISENTMTDGGTYQGANAQIRNIVLTLLENPNPNDSFVYDQANRDVLYSLFQKGTQGTFVYYENGTARQINYYCESIVREKAGKRPFVISLLCPDPMFHDIFDTIVAMANWIAEFEFVHEFKAEGEEIGFRSAEKSVNIVNDRATGNIGMKIIVDAKGAARNITITRIESDEHITIGSSGKNLDLVAGDRLIITTGVNDKHVRLVRNGKTTEINEYVTEDSEFIQIDNGNNNIAYSADSGDENLIITIHYKFDYEGV